jgi:hypothetical protein
VPQHREVPEQAFHIDKPDLRKLCELPTLRGSCPSLLLNLLRKSFTYKLLEKMKRSCLITATSDYLHAEFRTFLGFVDDVELFIDQEHHLIHMRSASRIGYWDLGVNRRRLEAIRREFRRTF